MEETKDFLQRQQGGFWGRLTGRIIRLRWGYPNKERNHYGTPNRRQQNAKSEPRESPLRDQRLLLSAQHLTSLRRHEHHSYPRANTARLGIHGMGPRQDNGKDSVFFTPEQMPPHLVALLRLREPARIGLRHGHGRRESLAGEARPRGFNPSLFECKQDGEEEVWNRGRERERRLVICPLARWCGAGGGGGGAWTVLPLKWERWAAAGAWKPQG
jgi:hypothetical protein